MAEYLFVLTRDAADASADYTLRIAVGLQRRRHQVTVILADDGASAACGGQCHPAVRVLLEAGARVLVLLGAGAEITPTGLEAASEEDLASLVLMPGVEAHWC